MTKSRFEAWIVVGCLALVVAMKLQSDNHPWLAVGLAAFFIVSIVMAYSAWKGRNT